MQSRITGTTMPVLEFALEPNDSIISEAGELSWMSSYIQMTTRDRPARATGASSYRWTSTSRRTRRCSPWAARNRSPSS